MYFLLMILKPQKVMWKQLNPSSFDQVEFIEGYHGAELDEYLLENVDIFYRHGDLCAGSREVGNTVNYN